MPNNLNITVVLLLGLPRSGTTFLQSELCKHDNVVGLGEVFQTTKALIKYEKKSPRRIIQRETNWNEQKYKAVTDKCLLNDFWREVVLELNTKPGIDLISAIGVVYKTAAKIYPGKVLIDSSKHHNQFSILGKLHFIRLLPCIVIRHPFAWLYSISKYNKKFELKRSSEHVELIRWCYSNNKLLNLTNKSNATLIYYDEYVLENRRIDDYFSNVKLGKESDELTMHEMVGSDSFLGSTNKRYDYSWITKTTNNKFFTAAIFPLMINILNKASVNTNK